MPPSVIISDDNARWAAAEAGREGVESTEKRKMGEVSVGRGILILYTLINHRVS